MNKGISFVPVVVALVALVAPPVAAAPRSPEWTVEFDGEVTGDLAVVGNTVTRCPAAATACRAEENGAGNGVVNNDNPMVWADTDDDPRTVTSSSATLDIPAGARVVHATLSWAGTLRAGSTGLCGRTGTWPADSPRAVTLAVGTGPADPLPATEFAAAPAPPGADRWYSAHTDVTTRLAGVRGPAVLTVGDVVTGQGFDCAGGWSLTAVWRAEHAPRHRVVVYTGHSRVAGVPTHVVLAPPGLRVAGGTTRLGIVALEGDRGLRGDSLLVNGVAQPEADNFFVAAAAGARQPEHVDNMSVDARTVELGQDVVRPGDTGVDVVATSGADEYLLGVLALSVPLPGLAVTTTVDHPVRHEGDPVTQRAVVTNTGAVPLPDVDVVFDLSPACRRVIRLAAGASSDITCTGQAAGDLVVSAAAGGPLTAMATAAARVIHPRLDLAVSTPYDVAVTGEPVEHRVTATNSGDAPLTSVRVGAPGCAGLLAAALAPGAAATTTCTGPATEDALVASAVDELGAPVTASVPAPYRMVAVGLTIDVVVPDGPFTPGGLVTLTVRVRNTSDVPLTDVTVRGEPASCHRTVPELAAGATTVHTCRVAVTGPVRVALTVAGVPRPGGVPAVVASAGVRTIVPTARPAAAVPEPEETQAPQPSRPTTDAGPLREPVTPAVIAVLGVMVMTVSVGGLAAAVRRR